MSESEFLGVAPLRVELLDSGKWALLSPLVFRSAALDRTVVVPLGFETDFASVPRLPIVFLLTANRAYKAAVVHDYALESGMEREDAATLFREAMEAEGIPEGLREIMYAGVRLHDQSYRRGPGDVPPIE